MRKFLLIFFLACFGVSSVLAATIHLKSGKQAKGEIVEITDEYIKLDFDGTVLTYWTEEVDYIQSEDADTSNSLTISSKQSQGADLPKEPASSALQDYAKESSKSFLWKIETQKAIVYMLGSIHIANNELYPLDKRIEDAFKACDTLVVEINVNDIDPLTVQEEFLAKGTYSNGQTLQGNISDETFQQAKKKVEDFGLDIEKMSDYKPWFLGFNIAILELSKLGFDFDQGIDQHFLNKAEANKEILDLETVDYQLSLFDGLSNKQQELFLISTLVEADILEKEINNMFSAWKKGDVKAMVAISQKALKENPVLLPIYNMLFYKRNEEMASKIEGLLSSGGNYFVIVGAGHLIGQKGIIEILEKEGYSVWQL
jgi:uncharacterized protein YbaP (TraB family)